MRFNNAVGQARLISWKFSVGDRWSRRMLQYGIEGIMDASLRGCSLLATRGSCEIITSGAPTRSSCDALNRRGV